MHKNKPIKDQGYLPMYSHHLSILPFLKARKQTHPKTKKPDKQTYPHNWIMSICQAFNDSLLFDYFIKCQV